MLLTFDPGLSGIQLFNLPGVLLYVVRVHVTYN